MCYLYAGLVIESGAERTSIGAFIIFLLLLILRIPQLKLEALHLSCCFLPLRVAVPVYCGCVVQHATITHNFGGKALTDYLVPTSYQRNTHIHTHPHPHTPTPTHTICIHVTHAHTCHTHTRMHSRMHHQKCFVLANFYFALSPL